VGDRRGRKGKPKVPKQAVPTSGEKRPRLLRQTTGTDDRPAWRFAHCDHDGPFPWSWDAFIRHFEKLMDMEAKPWPQFTLDGSIGAKRIPLENLPDTTTARLRRLKLDDADALWELRMGNKPRFWGVRIRNCFHFLWWDPSMLCAPANVRQLPPTVTCGHPTRVALLHGGHDLVRRREHPDQRLVGAVHGVAVGG
jgi:hypothetical protein